MFFFIDQQLMRQNSLYYRLYVELRSNKNWRLVNYSYYEKYVINDDNIFFRHINQNILQLIFFDRDVNMIQETLFLNDEDFSNCTRILSSMHNHLSIWWKRIVDCNQASNNYIHQITDQMYTKKNAENFNSKWIDVICKRENVRITLFSLSHESAKLARSTRRILLFWFVLMKEDDEILKNIEMSIWFELSIAHRDFTTSKRSSSRFINCHELISYRFSFAIEVTDLNALLNALICRIRWFSFLIQNEKNMILKRKMKVMQAIKTWRMRTIKFTIRFYQIVKIVEMRAFEDKFFYHLKTMIQEDLILVISDDVNLEIEKKEKWRNYY